jgi:hypothetical protein
MHIELNLNNLIQEAKLQNLWSANAHPLLYPSMYMLLPAPAWEICTVAPTEWRACHSHLMMTKYQRPAQSTRIFHKARSISASSIVTAGPSEWPNNS